jgi:predicted MFS family arabinose efflux permease
VIALALRVLPDDQGLGIHAGADVPGALLVTAGLVVGIFGVVRMENAGTTRTVGTLAGAVALLAAFVVRQRTARTPLMPLRILRDRNVAGANVVQVLMVAALFPFQILLALYLQRVGGHGAAGTGLAMLPAAVVIGAVTLGVSARLIGRFGERPVLLTGLALLLGLFLLLTRLPADATYAVDVLPAMLLAAGFGLALPALTGLGMSGAKADDAGLASGLFNTTQQIGMALGAATLATLAAARTADRAALGEAAALTAGYRLAFAVGAGLVVVAAVVALTVLRPRKRRGDAHRAAAPVQATGYRPGAEERQSAECASR